MHRNRNGHARNRAGVTEWQDAQYHGMRADAEDQKRRRCGRQAGDFASRVPEPEDPFDAEEEIARYLARKREGWDE